MSKTPDIDQIELAVCEADEPEPEPPSLLDKLKSSWRKKPVSELTPEQIQQNHTVEEMSREGSVAYSANYVNPSTGELYPPTGVNTFNRLNPYIQQYSPGNMTMVITSGSFYSNPTPEISLNAPEQPTTDFFLTDREGPQSEFDTLPEGTRQRSGQAFRTIPSEAFQMGQPREIDGTRGQYADDVRFGVILYVPREWMQRFVYNSEVGRGRTNVETNEVFSEAMAYYWMRFNQDEEVRQNIRTNVGINPRTDCIEVSINSSVWYPGLAPVFQGDNLPIKLMDGQIVRDVRDAYVRVRQARREAAPF